MDLKVAGTKRKIQIAELEKWRKKAYHSAKLYKERIKRWHNKRIKNSSREIRYFCLTLAFVYLVLVSIVVSGNALT
jgi:hypothetical protein